MKEGEKTKEQLLDELAEMRHRVAELEASKVERKRAEEASQLRLGNLRTIVEVAARLSVERSVDDLCRRAVELGREKLDIDRMSIWLVEEENIPTRIRGTFGTDEEGQTRDERGSLVDSPAGSVMWRVLMGRSRGEAREEELVDDQGRTMGFGWKTVVLLEGRDGSVLGALAADSLLTHRVWDDHTVEILKLYGLSIGRLLDGARMQEALRESEEKLRLIFDNAFDGISIYEELVESGTRRLLECNERYAEMAGRSRRELLEIGNTSLIPHCSRNRLAKN